MSKKALAVMLIWCIVGNAILTGYASPNKNSVQGNVTALVAHKEYDEAIKQLFANQSVLGMSYVKSAVDNIADVRNNDVSEKIQDNFIVNNYSSNTNSLIYVDLKNQIVHIYNGAKNSWKETATFSCAGGAANTPTVEGIYTVNYRGTVFFNSDNVGGKYWTRFYGSYLFHSQPINKKYQIVDATLGKPASHGCVRLLENNAKYIYDTVPNGTKVIVTHKQGSLAQIPLQTPFSCDTTAYSCKVGDEYTILANMSEKSSMAPEISFSENAIASGSLINSSDPRGYLYKIKALNVGITTLTISNYVSTSSITVTVTE